MSDRSENPADQQLVINKIQGQRYKQRCSEIGSPAYGTEHRIRGRKIPRFIPWGNNIADNLRSRLMVGNRKSNEGHRKCKYSRASHSLKYRHSRQPNARRSITNAQRANRRPRLAPQLSIAILRAQPPAALARLFPPEYSAWPKFSRLPVSQRARCQH